VFVFSKKDLGLFKKDFEVFWKGQGLFRKGELMKSPFTHNGAQTSYSWGLSCESNLHCFSSHQTPMNKGIQ